MPEKFKLESGNGKENPEPIKPEEKEQVEQLPSFIYYDGDRITNGVWEESDVTKAYEDFLKSTGKQADDLPSFLYKDGESIYMGAQDESDVTEGWREWVKTLKPIERKEE